MCFINDKIKIRCFRLLVLENDRIETEREQFHYLDHIQGK